MSMNIDCTALDRWVRSNLSSRRFQHCKQVARTCLLLSRQYHDDFDEALLYQCGILHDIAREWSSDALENYASVHHLSLLEEEKQNSVLLHAPVGAALLSEMGYEPLLCTAVRYHTIGSIQMGRLGLILYLADFLEPGRLHLDQKRRQELSRASSLESLCIEVLKMEHGYLSSKGKEVSQTSVQLLSYLTGGGRL